MLLLSQLLIAAGLDLAAGAPRKSYHRSHQRPNCRTEYTTVWETEYQYWGECVTKWVPECTVVPEKQCRPTTREVCENVHDRKCTTVWNTVCEDEYETYTETECESRTRRFTDEEACKYTWNGGELVAIPGTCEDGEYTLGGEEWVVTPENIRKIRKRRNADKEDCKEVTKERKRPVCRKVEEEKCADVPRRVCNQVPDESCSNHIGEECTMKPMKKCDNEHKKVPVEISRKVLKVVCDDHDCSYDCAHREDCIDYYRHNC